MKRFNDSTKSWRLVLATLILSSPVAALSETVTLAAVADTSLFENAPNNNLGGVVFMPIGTTAVGTRCHGLVKFDLLENIPIGATIISASLDLRVTQGNGFRARDYSVYRMVSEWGEGTKSNGPNASGSIGAAATEGESSWNRRFAPSVAWGAVGGERGVDFADSPSATASVGGVGNYQFTGPSMVADLQTWSNDPDSNFGWIIIVDQESDLGNARRFASRESGSNPPRLTVEFESPLLIDSATLDGDQVLIHFQAESGQSYILQRRPVVASGTWTTITNIPSQGESGSFTVIDQVTPGSQFYRLGRE